MSSYQIPKLLVIDAKDHVMGRLAATIAKHLMQHCRIIVLRCEKIVMSGHRIRNKLKMRHFFSHRTNTNPRRGPFHHAAPNKMFYRVVRGMIQHKSNHGRRAMRYLTCYCGIPPRFTFTKKVRLVTAYKCLRMDPNRPMTVLGNLMGLFGWTDGGLIGNMVAKTKIKQKAAFKWKKEVHKMKQQAIKNVAAKMGKKYKFLTQYEWDLPLDATTLKDYTPVKKSKGWKKKYRGYRPRGVKKAAQK